LDSYDTDNGATNGDGKFINIERVAIGRGFCLLFLIAIEVIVYLEI